LSPRPRRGGYSPWSVAPAHIYCLYDRSITARLGLTMTYQPWFYLIAFAFWVGLGVLIGLRARRPASVWGWSIGIGAFAALGTVLFGTLSPVDAMIDLLEVSVMMAGPAFAIRAIVTRLRPAGNNG